MSARFLVEQRPAPGSHRQHGTHVRYVQGPNENDIPGRGCRCDPCRAANTAYERARARRAEPAYISAEPARAHVGWLSGQGVGLKTIAKRSGVSHGTLSKLIYGTPDRGPSKRIRPATSAAILAVTPSAGAAGSRVPAGPTWEAVDQLISRGWTKTAIAREIGQTGPGLQLGTEYVTRRNARVIRGLLDQPVPDRRTRWGTRPAPEPEPSPEANSGTADDHDQFRVRLGEILEARIDQNAWRRRAACIGHPKWLFFPSRGDAETVTRARAVCRTCPVQSECLADNLGQRHGIWGGTSESERRTLRREQAA